MTLFTTKMNHKRFFIIYFVILIAVIICSVSSYVTSKDTIRNEVSDATLQTVKQLVERMDIEFNQVSRLLGQVNYNPQFRSMLKSVEHPFAEEKNFFDQRKQINSQLDMYRSSYQHMKSIRIVGLESIKRRIDNSILSGALGFECSSNGSDGSFAFDETNNKLINQIQSIDNDYWVPTLINGWLKRQNIDTKNILNYQGPTITLFTPYKNLQSKGGEKFVLVAEVKLKLFDSIFDQVKFREGSFYDVIDEHNNIVFSSEANKLTDAFQMEGLNDLSQPIQFIKSQGIEYMVVIESSKVTKWKLVTLIPTSRLFSEVEATLWTSVVVLILLVAISLMTFLLFNRFVMLNQHLQSTADELRNSNTQLEHQSAELKRMNELKDQILSNTSHELRTPLNGIIGIAESLLDGVGGKLNEVIAKNMRLIVASGRRLNNLVNDILDFNKIKNNKLQLRSKPMQIGPVLEMTIALLRSMLGHKSIEIINEINRYKQPLVLADENRVQQILHNLLANAIKFTESGTITISSIRNEDMLLISITDTGIGIPENRLEDVFKSFEQLDGSIERTYGGTGLGLAVTKQLIELHQGTIHVTSTIGVGSTFTFTLPLARQSDEYVEIHPINEVSNNHVIDVEWGIDELLMNSFGSGNHILIVDDEPINLHVLVNHLSQYDFKMSTAANGVEALAMIKQGLLPDLILLDVMMPKMSGYDVTKLIRETYPATQLPIILLTAKTENEDIVRGFQSGANDYITKPFSKTELIARIELHLKVTRGKMQLVDL